MRRVENKNYRFSRKNKQKRAKIYTENYWNISTTCANIPILNCRMSPNAEFALTRLFIDRYSYAIWVGSVRRGDRRNLRSKVTPVTINKLNVWNQFNSKKKDSYSIFPVIIFGIETWKLPTVFYGVWNSC